MIFVLKVIIKNVLKVAEKVKNKFDNYDKYGSLGGIAGLYAGWLVIAVIDVTLSDRATCWYKTFRLAVFFIKNNN